MMKLLPRFREEFYRAGEWSAICAKNLWNGKGCAMIAKRIGARENFAQFSRILGVNLYLRKIS